MSGSQHVKLKQGIIEISNIYLQIEGLNESTKEIAAKLTEEMEIEKGLVTKLAKMYHKQNYSKVQNETEELLNKYDEVMGSN